MNIREVTVTSELIEEVGLLNASAIYRTKTRRTVCMTVIFTWFVIVCVASF